jgi:hypothetical protein
VVAGASWSDSFDRRSETILIAASSSTLEKRDANSDFESIALQSGAIAPGLSVRLHKESQEEGSGGIPAAFAGALLIMNQQKMTAGADQRLPRVLPYREACIKNEYR